MTHSGPPDDKPAAGSRPRHARKLRRRLRWPLLLLGPLVVGGFAAWLHLTGGRFETTDDAYIQTARVAISANVAGRVKELAVRDNQPVRKGDVLFRLEDAPLRIAVEETAAQLASARLQITVLKANYRQRREELTSAKNTLAFQQRELERQQRLLASGIAAQSQVDRVAHALDEARAQVAGAEQQISAVIASLGGDPDIAPERHPTVQHAQALHDRARLNLSYTVIKSPGTGVVTRVEQLQVGNYINAASPVFALVLSGNKWVEANFKEDQLTHIRVGQPVTIQIDTYPGRTFAGKVASMSPGTGSQFSVLPAENATGNWVKVVQRLPVRVELDAPDPGFPLHAGLSAYVSVDTGERPRSLWPAQASSRAR
jgi:membrane fusion protein (multidrug efflux system)